jgi:hypothetical protein
MSKPWVKVNLCGKEDIVLLERSLYILAYVLLHKYVLPTDKYLIKNLVGKYVLEYSVEVTFFSF